MFERSLRFMPVALVLGGLLAGCELFHEVDAPPQDYTDVTDIRFSEHVLPLLEQKCTDCHGGSAPEAGLRLDSWNGLRNGATAGQALVPFDAGHSLLVQLFTGGARRHPPVPDADTLSQEEVDFLARWIDEGARNDAGEVPYAGATQRLYVTDQDEAMVSVVDMEANVVMRNVKLDELGFSANARPHHVAVEPDGSFWYVTLIGDNRVVKFDRDFNVVGQVDMETPGMLALHPTQDLLFVGRSMTAVSPPASLGVITRSTMALREVPVVFPRPHALAVEGGFAYAASLAENRLAAVDVETGDVAFVALDGPAQAFVQFAVAPDGLTMYLSAQLSAQMHLFSLVDPAAPFYLRSLDVGAAPWHPVYTPDGDFVYVPTKGTNSVTVIDARQHRVVDVVQGEALAEPHGSAVRPDGRYVYVSGNNTRGTYRPRYAPAGVNDRVGTVVVIDTATNEIVRVIEVGANPTGLAR